jgi:hypothetical protein
LFDAARSRAEKEKVPYQRFIRTGRCRHDGPTSHMRASSTYGPLPGAGGDSMSLPRPNGVGAAACIEFIDENGRGLGLRLRKSQRLKQPK